MSLASKKFMYLFNNQALLILRWGTQSPYGQGNPLAAIAFAYLKVVLVCTFKIQFGHAIGDDVVEVVYFDDLYCY